MSDISQGRLRFNRRSRRKQRAHDFQRRTLKTLGFSFTTIVFVRRDASAASAASAVKYPPAIVWNRRMDEPDFASLSVPLRPSREKKHGRRSKEREMHADGIDKQAAANNEREKMKRNHGWVWGVLLLSVLASACASVRRPEIELTAVRLGGIGLRGASLIAELDINNQNDFDIETDSIAYRLFANTSSDGSTWEPVLQRTFTQRILIEEDKTTRVEIPIEFNYSELSGAARTIIDRGILNYRIEGHAFMREPLRRTIPFTKTGSVSLSGAR